jgi:hypothetical protein
MLKCDISVEDGFGVLLMFSMGVIQRVTSSGRNFESRMLYNFWQNSASITKD